MPDGALRRRVTSRPGRWVAVVLIGAMVAGCPPQASPIERALDYLDRHQVPAHRELDWVPEGRRDFEGNWPQHFYFADFPALRIREVSPFMVAFVHHALALVTPENAVALGLDDADSAAAGGMRVRAVEFMRRFEAPADSPAAGTFGFWPDDPDLDAPDPPLAGVLFELLGGPVLLGTRTPLNLDWYPNGLALPSDADVTGAVYTALLDDAALDGGAGFAAAPEQFFADLRDDGSVPRRLNPPWLPDESGAFLTWLNYQPGGVDPAPNDVDLVVNATVLYALGRLNALDTSGVNESIALINDVVAQGIHRTSFDTITDYYPDNYAFEYFVTRAFREGGVTGLEPAVEILADDVELAGITDARGRTHWDRGDPHLNTAFAILVLLNAGRNTPLIDQGVDYLIAEQHPKTGAWDESVFFIARVDSGRRINWASAPLTTAMALEALCRYELER